MISGPNTQLSVSMLSKSQHSPHTKHTQQACLEGMKMEEPGARLELPFPWPDLSVPEPKGHHHWTPGPRGVSFSFHLLIGQIFILITSNP